MAIVGTKYRRWGKRVFDIIVSVTWLVILAPLLILLTVMVRIRLGRPVFFRQLRPGLCGRPFELIKFRSMRDEIGGDGHALTDAERLTKFGRKLRAWSLDELPTLWNVISGEMSLVGPRPLLVQYLDRYSPEQARRHDVKPGIAGLAQLNGRNAISWEEKFRFDVWYVDNVTFCLDLKILAMTVLKVIKREGINQPGHATMEGFQGIATRK